MKNEETQDAFSTRDISLAATLVTLKFNIIGIDYQIEGERQLPVGYFSFEKSSEIKETEKQYWAGELSVEPKTFMTNVRALKAQVNNNYKSPHSNF